MQMPGLFMFLLFYGIWVLLCFKLPNDGLLALRGHGFFDPPAGAVARVVGMLLLILPVLIWLWMVLGWQSGTTDWPGSEQVGVCAGNEGQLDPIEEAWRIQVSLTQIEKLPLGQAQQALEEVLHRLQQLHKEAHAQASCIDALRLRARGYLEQADQARRWRDAISTVSEQQTEVLELMLSKTVDDASKLSFWQGALVSFPIGLLTSIIGGLILLRLRGLGWCT